MGYPWPTPQEREAKRLQSEAAAIASGIRNADDVDTTYQGGLSDSLRAIKNIPQASEYTKRSGVTWNPNVATTQQIQEENQHVYMLAIMKNYKVICFGSLLTMV